MILVRVFDWQWLFYTITDLRQVLFLCPYVSSMSLKENIVSREVDAAEENILSFRIRVDFICIIS